MCVHLVICVTACVVTVHGCVSGRYDELLNNYDGIKAELEATFADINDM